MDLAKTIRDWQRRNWFGEMVALGDQDKDLERSRTALRVVVLVRDDILPPIHQGIQAAHAISHLAVKAGAILAASIADSYLILLGAEEWQMVEKVELARKKKKLFAMYEDNGLIDPDTGSVVWTATAFEPMKLAEVQRYFGNLKRSE